MTNFRGIWITPVTIINAPQLDGGVVSHNIALG